MRPMKSDMTVRLATLAGLRVYACRERAAGAPRTGSTSPVGWLLRTHGHIQGV